MKKAFTLIELLVVIAIIAILAAILFPVFAQAKLAAKKAASLSNVKEIGLGEIMYSGDYDDNFVMATQDVFNDACAPNVTPTAYSCHGGTVAGISLDWPMLLQPYIKSLGLYVDPGTGDPLGIFGSGTHSITANWNRFAEYGYNFEFLAPITSVSVETLPANDLANSNTLTYSQGRSTTAALKPAETVMFDTAEGAPTSTANGTASFPTLDMSDAPGTWNYALPSPTHFIFASQDPTTGSLSYTIAWFKNGPVGPDTSYTRATAPYNGSNVVWVDGHAKAFTADALAVGTDYGVATANSHTDGLAGGAIVTNLTTYLWSLDGTLNDIK